VERAWILGNTYVHIVLSVAIDAQEKKGVIGKGNQDAIARREKNSLNYLAANFFEIDYLFLHLYRSLFFGFGVLPAFCTSLLLGFLKLVGFFTWDLLGLFFVGLMAVLGTGRPCERVAIVSSFLGC